MPTYIIEHLEPELFEWCIVEYEEISKTVGKNALLFTNVKEHSAKLNSLGFVKKESVVKLKLDNACVLDPESSEELSSSDKFDYLIFGGILGDNPPRKRTEDELSSKINFPKRNLGKKQMSTDTAVKVTKLIVDGKKFSEIKFIDNPELEIADGEFVELPYRYLSKDGKPVIYSKIMEILKREGEF
ncbi:MAG: SAM-dependent methyltransferase [Nanoarchaeota archaeon]